MLKFKYWIYIILFIFIPDFSASGNINTVDTSSVIQVENNLLSVKARDIPLKKVLMEIAKQKHIKIYFYASVEEPLGTNFSSLPIEKGLARLLRNYSYAFTYDSAKSKSGKHEIRRVVILSNDGGSRYRGMEPTIAYREEPHLYDEQYDEDPGYQELENMYAEGSDFMDDQYRYDDDMSYQESNGMYNEHPDFQESEEMYDEDSGYLESENMYTEDPDYQESNGMYNEYPGFQENEEMYDEDSGYLESENMNTEDPDYQESEDTYPYESDMPGEDLPEELRYSGDGRYAGFN